LAFNGAVFAARSTLEILQRESREPSAAEAIIGDVVPPGARVVGDDKFYFAVRNAGADFQYLQRGGTPSERALYHKNVYDMQYLITDESETSDLFQAYAREMHLVPVGSITAPPQDETAQLLTAIAHWAGVGTSLLPSYQGTIFTRAAEPQTP